MVLNERHEAALRALAGKKRTDLDKFDTELFTSLVGIARPQMAGDVARIVQEGVRGRLYSISRKWQVASSSPDTYKDFTASANQMYLVQDGGSTQKQGSTLILSRFAIIMDSLEDAATIKEMMDGLGVRFHYGDGRQPFEVSFSDLAQTRVMRENAGNNTGTAVAGLRTVVDKNKITWFEISDPRDYIIVRPTDTKPRVELFWQYDYTANAQANPAGATANTYIHLLIQGMVYEPVGDRRK